MRVIVEITSAPDSSEKIRLKPGQTARVGRTSRADFAFPQDTYLSSLHFVLECEDDACRLRDLNSSNGTSVNGKQVSETLLRDGDEIVAGRTTFTVHIETDAPPLVESSPVPIAAAESAEAQSPVETSSSVLNRLLELLRGQPEPLYALLDAARDRRVLELLRDSKEKFQSLYEGEQGKELADYAPYLLSLPPQSDFLETLAREGWGQSWGLFLTSDKPFAKVRRYLRQFLIVKNENGRELYFRFYDPRVLRLFLPTCNAAEAARLFASINSYLVEDAEPETLLQFRNNGQGVEQRRLSLTAPEDASSR